MNANQIDTFAFSLGGMVAQDLTVRHPELVRRLVLTGTGPRGGKDIDKVVATTYWDILRSCLKTCTAASKAPNSSSTPIRATAGSSSSTISSHQLPSDF